MFGRKKYIFASRKNNRRRNVIITILIAVLLTLLAVFVIYPIVRPINYSVTVEAGSEAVDAAAFLKRPDAGKPVQLLWDVAGEPRWNVPGEYPVTVVYNETSYNAKVYVVDTQAPKAQGCDLTYLMDQEAQPQPMDFVAQLKDATEVAAVYRQAPDFNRKGTQQVVVLLTDMGGNETEVTATLTVTDDQEPPVIYGAKDRLTYQGAVIPLDDGIAVIDNQDPSPVLTVDSSAVDFSQRGVYPVTYRAVDSTGNATEITVQLTVGYRKQSAVSIENLNPAIDEKLAQIVTDGMSAEEKCRAVYEWCRANIHQSTRPSDKTAWTKEAYRVIRWSSGDSFTSSAFFHACMLRLGFQDMMMQQEGTQHYWNLVNLGDGWRHVDCGRISQAIEEPVFLLTDQQLAACSAQAGGSYYSYDAQQYPPAE